MNEDLQTAPLKLLLNLQMIADVMDDQFWEYEICLPGEKPSLRCCRLYFGQQELQEDVLYLVHGAMAEQFPGDRFSFVTNGETGGRAPHISRVNREFVQMCNLVMDVFQRHHDFETSLSGVVAGSGSLTQLCRIASDFFHNPVYIHDNMFTILAVSHHVDGMLQFEYNEKRSRGHIPLWLINEFKYDESYNATLSLRQASIWGNDQYPYNIRSLFVNLWDGDQYRGRVLINEIGSSLQPGQFRSAEYLARVIVLLLKQQEQRQDHQYRSFQQTLLTMINGEKVPERELHTMLTILDWDENDRYLCIKLQNQDPGISIRSDGALNSVLASILRGCVTFWYHRQLCILVNLTQNTMDPRNIRTQLAPHIRDSCMYGGISSPVEGILAIGQGFRQADIVLEFITNTDSSNWLVSFSDCVLQYLCDCGSRELPARMLVHPALLELMACDSDTGTRYFETLQTYLLCERNIPKTSAELIIHRTTLTYRLSRIQEITKLNLEDRNLRLHLQLSFYILEHGSGI